MFHWIQLWWDTWNLRAVILFSLFLQTFLFFSAPLRKRTTNSLVTIPIWLAYNLADATAIFGVGLISKPCGNALGASANPKLMAFWAPFLLLHLGGPDTITAFALEDNELWMRHLLQLVVQLATSAYVFILTLSSNNQLWLPTLLMFISALMKSTERTRSLYHASWRRFRDSMLREPDPGNNYHKLMDEIVEEANPEPSVGGPMPCVSSQESDLSSRLEIVEASSPESTVGDNNEPMPDTNGTMNVDLLQAVYLRFETVKGLIADLKFSARERDRSRRLFLNLTTKQAFESVKIELNFLYDILFTKITVVRGYDILSPSRFVSFVSCLAAFLLFHSMDPNHKFLHHKIDVEISYTLLLCSIIHDVIALFVVITSDWSSVTWTQDTRWLNRNDSLFDALCKSDFFNIGRELGQAALRACCFQIGASSKMIFFWLIPIMNRRWSGCISQYNLIFKCLHPCSLDQLIGILGLTNILDGMKYVKTEQFDEVLGNFIFEELKIKSNAADAIETAKELCSSKGDWVLRNERGCGDLLPHTLHADYDKILTLWHIATELCYHTEEGNSENHTEEGNSENQKFRKISKVLSDYMLYLLIMEPSMMSAVAGTAEIRFRDTCAEAKLFFQDRRILEEKEKYYFHTDLRYFLDLYLSTYKWATNPNRCRRRSKPDIVQACKSIIGVRTVVNPATVKGDTSKSVFFDACILAKKLEKLKKDKWKILSKVWVELLSYAACRCSANSHATQLSKGGQLISLVWLLMVHLGLGDQFEVSESHQNDPLSPDENHQQPDQRDGDLVGTNHRLD